MIVCKYEVKFIKHMNKILDLKIESFSGKLYNFNRIGPASVDGRVFEDEGEEKDEDNEDEVLPGD